MTDILTISQFVGALVVVVGAVWSIIMVVQKIVTWFRTRILDRIFALEQTTDEIKEDLYTSSEENIILMKGLKATLEAVSNKKCNGNVDGAIQEIDDYTTVRAHVLRSRKKEGKQEV